MHLRILREHQKPFLKKYIFYHLEWLKTCFDAFAHTSRPPEIFFKKDIFYRLEWSKTCVDAFAFSLPDHLKPFFKKDIFYCLKWLKTCFDAFAHTSRPPETFFKKIFF
jgi:hypothetical protein